MPDKPLEFTKTTTHQYLVVRLTDMGNASNGELDLLTKNLPSVGSVIAGAKTISLPLTPRRITLTGNRVGPE
jgi:hypothetical protein